MSNVMKYGGTDFLSICYIKTKHQTTKLWTYSFSDWYFFAPNTMNTYFQTPNTNVRIPQRPERHWNASTDNKSEGTGSFFSFSQFCIQHLSWKIGKFISIRNLYWEISNLTCSFETFNLRQWHYLLIAFSWSIHVK